MFGERIRTLRKEKGYSQIQVAQKLHVSQSAISQWEKDITTPSPDQLVALAQIFETTVDNILDNNNVNEKKPTPQMPKTHEARILSAGVDRMPEADRKRILKMVELMFEQYRDFFEGNDDN